MQKQQLELWKANERGLRVPPIHRELTADQRRGIIGRLARLILNQVRSNTDMATSANTNTENGDER